MIDHVTTTAGWLVLGGSLLLILVTLLPVIRSPRWWIRICDYPRSQIAAGLAIAAFAQVMIWPEGWTRLGLLAATLAALAWQGFRIWPYTPLHPVQVLKVAAGDAPPERTLSLFVANVLQSNRDAPALLALIRRTEPDIVLTLETDAWWDAQLHAALAEDFPHAVRHPLENTYGLHLYSRLKLKGAVVRERMERDIPSVFAQVQLRSGDWVDLHGLHPEPPQIANDTAERDAELVLVAKEVERDEVPTVVLGDLNDVAWSHTTRLFQRLSGMLDPRVGRGLYATFHAQHRFARWPLDHVFHDPCFRLVHLEVLPSFGSDHFAVVVRLLLDPTAAAVQSAPEADAEDHEAAREIVRDGREAAVEKGTASFETAAALRPA